MAIKYLEVPDIGEVRFQKRRGTRSLHLYIQGSKISVTMPHWVTYNEAIRFVRSRLSWINKHRTEQQIISHGALIGKNHELVIQTGAVQRPQTRIMGKVVRVQLPDNFSVEHPEAQQAIIKACERALTKEAKELLVPRLTDLAYEHGFNFQSSHVKKLQRRWGSCDSKGNITLNIFLSQLPWEHIDYVLLHELTHTKHLDHGPDFWQTLTSCLPDAKLTRKALKQFHPQLLPH